MYCKGARELFSQWLSYIQFTSQPAGAVIMAKIDQFVASGVNNVAAAPHEQYC